MTFLALTILILGGVGIAGSAIIGAGTTTEIAQVLHDTGRFFLKLSMGLFVSYVLLVLGSILISVLMQRLRTVTRLLGRSRSAATLTPGGNR